MKTTLLLVRHGQSEGNVAAVFTGHSGYPLSDLGHLQAERTAEYIKTTYEVDAVYSSDLPRAFQTAEHVARKFGLPIVTDARFREIRAAEWENKPFDKLPDLFPEAFALWRTDIGNSRCTGGEAVLEVAERMYVALHELARAYEGQCVVVATHATPIRAILWKLSGAPVSEMQHTAFGSNCAISELEFVDGNLKIVQSNFTGHLSGLETKLPDRV